MSVEEKKLELWQWALGHAWKRGRHNCVYDEIDGQRMRMNFRNSKTLKLERKVPLTNKEKQERFLAKKPMFKFHWIVISEQEYKKVIIDGHSLHFEPPINTPGKTKTTRFTKSESKLGKE